MENEPHQSRDRGTVCKEKRAILYGNEHVTMTLLLTSGSNHTIHIFVEHTAPHRRGGANQNDHRPHPTGGVGGDKARNDDITTNKRQQPYHTSVERGGANQKDHRPHSTGGGERGRGQTRPDGESNKAKQDNYPLDRHGGIPWSGGGRGGVAALHHVCICPSLSLCCFRS